MYGDYMYSRSFCRIHTSIDDPHLSVERTLPHPSTCVRHFRTHDMNARNADRYTLVGKRSARNCQLTVTDCLEASHRPHGHLLQPTNHFYLSDTFRRSNKSSRNFQHRFPRRLLFAGFRTRRMAQSTRLDTNMSTSCSQ
jgi:hypothetical protein